MDLTLDRDNGLVLIFSVVLVMETLTIDRSEGDYAVGREGDKF